MSAAAWYEACRTELDILLEESPDENKVPMLARLCEICDILKPAPVRSVVSYTGAEAGTFEQYVLYVAFLTDGMDMFIQGKQPEASHLMAEQAKLFMEKARKAVDSREQQKMLLDAERKFKIMAKSL